MGFLDKLRGKSSSPAGGAGGGAKAYDPVCGMTVDPKSAAGTSQHQGRTIHFCSTGCKQRFDADPQQFAARIR